MLYRYRILIAVEHNNVVEKFHGMEIEHLFIIEVVKDRETILNKLTGEYYDILLIEDKLPGLRIFNLVNFCHKHLPNLLPIIITNNSSIEKAVALIKAGAFHYLESPFSADKLETVLKNAVKQLEENSSNIKVKLEKELTSKRELQKKEYIEKKIRALEVLQIQTQFSNALTSYESKAQEYNDFLSESSEEYYTEDAKTVILENDENKIDGQNNLDVENLNPLPEYKYIRTLGAGTMGVVMLVEKDNKKFALKILNGQLQHSQKTTFIKRFLREAKVLSNFNHPNLIHIYEYGFRDNSNIPYILMEYVNSRTLEDVIKENKLSLEQKIYIITQLAAVLTVIHEQNIIHRDIKPGNILIDDELNIKLTDFGIAKDENSLMTREHEILGSPAYMPPEVFISSSKSSEQFDIFSLGVVSYEILTGKKPFKGRNINELKYNIKNSRPLEPRKINPYISEDLQNILSRMLRKRPEDRYQTSEELFNDLNNLGKKDLTFSGSLLRNLVHKAIRHWA
ncbi:protein kinase [Lentisphaerota bacterium WC36G]|nr:protein kinase [Lentisphaerae bacterium WC36]